MEIEAIHKHWETFAQRYGTSILATTKTDTIKKLEIDSFLRMIRKTGMADKKGLKILEVGCGNGHNCLAMSQALPNATFWGIDYSQQMVDAALKFREERGMKDRYHIQWGDMMKLSDDKGVPSDFDFAFTDRVLINLNTHRMQEEACDQIRSKVRPGGYFMTIENFTTVYERQNDLREIMLLDRRKPDSYNLFVDDKTWVPYLQKNMKLVAVENFGSLHDILLYVLIPALNGGSIDYKHPLMPIVTDLLMTANNKFDDAFGAFGQNQCYLFQKP
jgi:ubiquinone/menaquinone biosynthesis C-methylase UbiE